MQCLTKGEFLGAADPSPEWVPLPTLGEGKGLFVRYISGLALDQFLAEHSALGDRKRLLNFHGRVVVLCACDENGQPIFTAEDAPAVGAKCTKSLKPLFDAARRINSIFLSDEEEKALEKNSGSGVPVGSPIE